MGLRAWARGHRRVAPRPRRAARRGRGRGRGGEPERGGRLVTPAHTLRVHCFVPQCPARSATRSASCCERKGAPSSPPSVWCYQLAIDCHCALRPLSESRAALDTHTHTHTHTHTQTHTNTHCHTHIVGPDTVPLPSVSCFGPAGPASRLQTRTRRSRVAPARVTVASRTTPAEAHGVRDARRRPATATTAGLSGATLRGASWNSRVRGHAGLQMQNGTTVIQTEPLFKQACLASLLF